MKVRLAANAELDLLTKAELDQSLSDLRGWIAEARRGVKFRTISAKATVAGGVWTIPGGQHDLGPQSGTCWSVTALAVSGSGITAGTDRFSVYADDVSAAKLFLNGILYGQTWSVGTFVLGGGSTLAFSGAGTGGGGTEVWVSGTVAEVPEQLAHLFLG